MEMIMKFEPNSSFPTRRSLVHDMMDSMIDGSTIRLEDMPFNTISCSDGCIRLNRPDKHITLPHSAKKMPTYEVLDELHTVVLFNNTIFARS